MSQRHHASPHTVASRRHLPAASCPATPASGITPLHTQSPPEGISLQRHALPHLLTFHKASRPATPSCHPSSHTRSDVRAACPGHAGEFRLTIKIQKKKNCEFFSHPWTSTLPLAPSHQTTQSPWCWHAVFFWHIDSAMDVEDIPQTIIQLPLAPCRIWPHFGIMALPVLAPR